VNGLLLARISPEPIFLSPEFPGIFIFTHMKKQNLRSLAAQAIEQVVEQGQSLSNVLPALQQKVSDKDKALLQELCFGVTRSLPQLEWLLSKLMARPMTAVTCWRLGRSMDGSWRG
jgi:transcription termination factor NusB